jgi:hypothetical protein
MLLVCAGRSFINTVEATLRARESAKLAPVRSTAAAQPRQSSRPGWATIFNRENNDQKLR